MTQSYPTPIVFIVFNRPEETRRVFEQISKARPERLFVIADGPRKSKPNEARLVEEVRKISTAVSWPCELFTNFSDKNLGCRDRIVSGLDWVFSMVESAVILEDDCLPDPSFFPYCSELLERYKNNSAISHITGSNLLGSPAELSHSYWFSRHTQIWGWATWARVWRQYDLNASAWPKYSKSSEFRSRTATRSSRRYWRHAFNSVYKSKIDTWDYQFTLLNWVENMQTIVPTTNLISNIGFGPSATHTVDSSSKYSKTPSQRIRLPLVHADNVKTHLQNDLALETQQFRMGVKRYALLEIHNSLPPKIQGLIKNLYSISLRFFSR